MTGQKTCKNRIMHRLLAMVLAVLLLLSVPVLSFADEPPSPPDTADNTAQPSPSPSDKEDEAEPSPPNWLELALNAPRTDDSGYNVASIAVSQLGYEEDRKGNTIYGAWYGSPNADWCAIFACFCITLAGIPDMPIHAHCNTLANMYDEKGLFHPVSEGYFPRRGDIVFMDYNGDKRADHCGLVIYTDNELGYFETVEGNHNDAVGREGYLTDNWRIFGYGELFRPEEQPIPILVVKEFEVIE